MTLLKHLGLLGLGSLLWHCSGAEPQANTAFVAPSGMAVAGLAFDQVFVANSAVDALQVIQLQPQLKKIDMLRAPARYQPLYIAAGSQPTALASSADGHYVFVLDAAGGNLSVVDATTHLPVLDANGMLLSQSLNLSNSAATTPLDMVASPQVCSTRQANSSCLGRVFISLRDAAAVFVVDLLANASTSSTSPVLQWSINQQWQVGGAPRRMAIHPSGQALFLSDAQSPQLLRLSWRDNTPELAAGNVPNVPNVARFALSALAQDRATGEALAVTQDGSVIAVTRPQWRDVVLLGSSPSSMNPDTTNDSLQVLPQDPLWTPPPACLNACGASENACAAAHPADQALCSDGNNLTLQSSSFAAPYANFYLNAVPTQVTAVGSAAAPLLPMCGNAAATSGYTQAFAVATLEGSINFIGVRTTGGNLAPALLPADTCATAMLAYPSNNVPPASYLTPCSTPNTPQRLQCLGAGSAALDANDTQVLRLRGPLAPQAFQLQWEGILPDSGQRSGEINSDGSLTDPSGAAWLASNSLIPQQLDAAGNVVYAGDTLEIVGAKLLSNCMAAADCHTERHIQSLRSDGQNLVFTLSAPLSPACFKLTQVSYRLRASGAYLVSTMPAAVLTPQSQRLGLGATYGLATPQQISQGILFQTQVLPVASQLNACQIYDALGQVLPTMATQQSPLLNRAAALTFSVIDPLTPASRGVAINALAGDAQAGSDANLAPSLGTSMTLGRLPGSLLSTPATPAGLPAWLLLSYAGSNSVLLANPSPVGQRQIDDVFNRVLSIR